MSGLIKQREAITAVAALPIARPRRDSGAAVDLPAPDPRLAELEAEVTRLEAALVAQKSDAARAIEGARKEGQAAAVVEDAKRTALVERGLGEARAAWDARLEDLDILAVKLARAALAKMFGDNADLGDLVARTVAHHLGGLAADAVVGVRVSPEDFPGDAIEALGARLDLARSRLAVDPDLDAGGCRIDLKLGAMDVEPARQWAILDRALATMERAE
jgi:type III secretion protein L